LGGAYIAEENKAAKPVDLGGFLVQPWCNKRENHLVLMPKRVYEV